MIHGTIAGRRLRTAGLAAAAAAASMIGGCKYFGLGLYAIMAEQTRTEKADYDLKPAAERGDTMVIRVWTDSAIAWNHERAPLHLAQTIRSMLHSKDPESGADSPLLKLKIVDPRLVERYLQSRPDGGDSVSARELSDRFRAKIVLDISLEEYTIKAPDSEELFQGRLVGVVNLYDFNKGEESQLPVGKRRVTVSFPDRPGDVQGSEDSEFKILAVTRALFAEKVFNKVHDREVPLKPDLKEQYRNRD